MRIRRRLMIVFFSMCVDGCSGMRPPLPADPNQAILMMMQQRSMEKMMNEWSTRPQEEDLNKCRGEVSNLEKLLRESISRPCACPSVEPDNFQG